MRAASMTVTVGTVGSKVEKVAVANLADASRVVCAYIDGQGIGGSEWHPKAGCVSENGKAVAHVSYNGRVWTPDEKTLVLEAVRS